MADVPVWYSKAKADKVFATKDDLAQARLDSERRAPDLSGLATKAEVTQADTALGGRVDAVKATAEAALPAATAASTYATKAEMQAADGALGQRIDGVKTTADAALPKAEAESTYATKEALAEATSAQSGLQSKVSSLEAAVEQKAAKTDLTGYLTTTAASDTYAARSALGTYLPKADAASTYAAKEDLEAVKAQVAAAPTILALGKNDPVPAGTKPGTIIVRKDA